MNHKIIARQGAAKECFICGTENEGGLHAAFYELDNKKVVCVFTAKDIHGGHPGILHGGVICSILDETAGRAMTVLAPENTGALTVQLEVKSDLVCKFTFRQKSLSGQFHSLFFCNDFHFLRDI